MVASSSREASVGQAQQMCGQKKVKAAGEVGILATARWQLATGNGTLAPGWLLLSQRCPEDLRVLRRQDNWLHLGSGAIPPPLRLMSDATGTLSSKSLAGKGIVVKLMLLSWPSLAQVSERSWTITLCATPWTC